MHRFVHASGSRDDAHIPTLQRALDGELDGSGDLGEKRVVLADPDIVAGVELGAALANDDVASRNQLTTETLHAKTL